MENLNITFTDAAALPFGTSIADIAIERGMTLWSDLQVRWYLGLLYTVDKKRQDDLPFPHTIAFSVAASIIVERFSENTARIWQKNVGLLSLD